MFSNILFVKTHLTVYAMGVIITWLKVLTSYL